MLDINLIQTKEPEVTVVPGRIRLVLQHLLDVENISYKKYDQDHFQDGWPGWITYREKLYTENNFAFVTTVTRDSLFDAAEKLWMKGPEHIDEWEAEKKKRGL